jgi:hypothetical protein
MPPHCCWKDLDGAGKRTHCVKRGFFKRVGNQAINSAIGSASATGCVLRYVFASNKVSDPVLDRRTGWAGVSAASQQFGVYFHRGILLLVLMNDKSFGVFHPNVFFTDHPSRHEQIFNE